MTPDLVDPVIDVHLKGAFNVTRPAWIRMREQGYGRIVSTSSAAGIFGNFGQANYGAAKMGLVGFSRVLAAEGAKYNIKANVIAPLALTRMTENLMGAIGDKLDPALVTPIVAWLSHEDCDVTGEIYSVGGGRVARVFIGETQGYYKPGISLEDIRDNWEQILNTDGYVIPANLPEETESSLQCMTSEDKAPLFFSLMPLASTRIVGNQWLRFFLLAITSWVSTTADTAMQKQLTPPPSSGSNMATMLSRPRVISLHNMAGNPLLASAIQWAELRF